MSIFSKLAEGLKKTKEAISKKFYSVFTARALDDDFYEDLEYALISSDVGASATQYVIDRLKEEAYERRLKSADSAKELFRDILMEIVDFDLEPYSYPLVILVAGVNGVGKTTAIGKLAYLFSKDKSVVLAAADTFRAAADAQLAVWADRSNVRIIRHEEGSDPASVVFDAIASAKAKGTDVVLIDTAGRLHNKKNLMDELRKIDKVVKREYPEAEYHSFLVLDATTGQNAVTQTKLFDEAIDIDGIILTKLDGTAKGGVVIAIAEEMEIPIRYVGVGESKEDLLPFDPKDFINNIL